MDIQKIIPAQATATSRDKPRIDGEERHAGGLWGNFTFATLQTTEFQVIHRETRNPNGYHFKTHKSCNARRRYQNNGGTSQEGRSNPAASQNMATIFCTQNVRRKSTFAGRGFAGQSPMVRPWNRPDTLFCGIRVFRGRTHPSLPNFGRQGKSFSQGFHRAFNEVSGWLAVEIFVNRFQFLIGGFASILTSSKLRNEGVRNDSAKVVSDFFPLAFALCESRNYLVLKVVSHGFHSKF